MRINRSNNTPATPNFHDPNVTKYLFPFPVYCYHIQITKQRFGEIIGTTKDFETSINLYLIYLSFQYQMVLYICS